MRLTVRPLSPHNQHKPLFYSFESFSHQHYLMVFHWSLNDIKSLQDSKTLLSILADVNNSVVWMVTTRPPIFKSSSPLTKPFDIVPSTPITIGITVTFVLHSFFSSLARSTYVSFFWFSFIFTPRSAGTATSTIRQVLFSFFFFLFFFFFFDYH